MAAAAAAGILHNHAVGIHWIQHSHEIEAHNPGDLIHNQDETENQVAAVAAVELVAGEVQHRQH